MDNYDCMYVENALTHCRESDHALLREKKRTNDDRKRVDTNIGNSGFRLLVRFHAGSHAAVATGR